MAYYHVSSYAQDGQVYLTNQKPLQRYIDEFETLSADSYTQFINTCNLIPATILQETGIRKSKWLCELVFESVRKERFIWAPRRMHSIYLCSSLEEAQLFNKNFRGNRASVYEAVFDGAAYQFNMKAFTNAEEYLFDHINALTKSVYEQLRTYAYKYWSQERPMEQIEYIYEGTVKLMRVLNI